MYENYDTSFCEGFFMMFAISKFNIFMPTYIYSEKMAGRWRHEVVESAGRK
jgi:hypothetical protein